MHTGNRIFWARTKERYPAFFEKRRVLECGSREHNGSVRDYFDQCSYTGIDWQAGSNVDVVTLVHHYYATPPFDVVISASLLEHDPHWEQSITRMVELLAEDGILLLSWGAAENQEHCLDDAPDGLFHPLAAGRVLTLLEYLGIYVHEFIYESTLSSMPEPGCVALVAFKNKKLAVGEPEIQQLHEADRR